VGFSEVLSSCRLCASLDRFVSQPFCAKGSRIEGIWVGLESLSRSGRANCAFLVGRIWLTCTLCAITACLSSLGQGRQKSLPCAAGQGDGGLARDWPGRHTEDHPDRCNQVCYAASSTTSKNLMHRLLYTASTRTNETANSESRISCSRFPLLGDLSLQKVEAFHVFVHFVYCQRV
jgi:hypothetical protein